MKNILSILLAVLLCAVCTPAFAHPASDVIITVNGETVTVTALHNVKDPANHYIEAITLLLNDTEVGAQELTSQTDNEKQVTTFTVTGMKEKDWLKAKTVCNKGGERAGTLEIA